MVMFHELTEEEVLDLVFNGNVNILVGKTVSFTIAETIFDGEVSNVVDQLDLKQIEG